MSYRNYYSLCKPSIAETNSVKFLPKNCDKKSFNTYKYPYTTFHPYLPPGEIRSIEANVSCSGGGNIVSNQTRGRERDNIIYDQQLPSYRREFNTIAGDIRENFVHPSKMNINNVQKSIMSDMR